MTPYRTHRDAAVLGFSACEFDVVAAPFFGQFGQNDTRHLAVVAGVDAQVRIADRPLDCTFGADVIGTDDHGAGLGDVETGELFDRDRLAVVFRGDTGEPREESAPGSARSEVVAPGVH